MQEYNIESGVIVDSNNPFYWYARVWRRGLEFTGRSHRKEYWWFQGVNMLLVVLVVLFNFAWTKFTDSGPHLSNVMLVCMGAYAVAGFLPSLAVTIRRLHDSGRSGWWILIQCVPYLGALICLVFTLLDSDLGANRFGPNPKAPEELDLEALEQMLLS